MGAAQSFWSEELFTETFFCDAGKIDVAQMNLHPKGIGRRGEPKPAVVCMLLKHSEVSALVICACLAARRLACNSSGHADYKSCSAHVSFAEVCAVQ